MSNDKAKDPADTGDSSASTEAGIGYASDEAGIGYASTEAGIGYASALSELEAILAELEGDEVDIDVLSARVERAAELISVCRSRIRKADERVSRIVAELEPDATEPLDDDQ